MKSYHYPFCAVVGQRALKQALILSAIDPKLGGVLISGPRGMGKTTLARGLGDLLSEHSLTHSSRPFVTLPLGATEEKLIGSLDIERVLANGEVAFSPGILARAHNGILYVDEVNLLPDHLVDLLLDVAASGVNHVERDGISQEHDSQFVLVGTMNPDEGDLRPQLLDRFGLFVDINEQLSPQERVEAVHKRLAFDDNPVLFIESVAEQQLKLHNELVCAQTLLPDVIIAEEEQLKIAEICAASGAEGLRADITLQRAAKAEAAWHGETRVSLAHISAVEEFVLAHRRKTLSPQPPAPQPPKDQSPQRENNHSRPQQDKSAYADRGSRFTKPRAQGSSNSSTDNNESDGQWGAMTTTAMATMERRTVNLDKINDHHRAANSRVVSGQKGSGQATLAPHSVGQFSQIEQTSKISWVPTLTDASNIRKLRISDTGSAKLSRLHYLRPQQKPGQLNLVLIDSSASTSSHHALGKSKGVVAGLSHQSYLDRQELAIIEFGNNQVSTRLHPQRAPKVIEPILDSIKLGGGTPLRKALLQAKELLLKTKARTPDKSLCLYLLTDGRSNDDLSGLSSIHVKTGARIVVIDTEQQAIRLGRCHNIAAQLNGEYVHIDDLPTDLATKPHQSTSERPLLKGASS
ncbi:AAA family ATPase [Alkalimarinus sediminis]|uniref:ATP-binding protein n=1 Tax=Alkalimarinus sediminis TaxID=1632866 RepID=A0A9E8HR57_9ALTE|nr:AAA family ATPase [Alkalimarinus sediminis]UZW74981.1 ATP-binding protein [Alkalimarinus sediminis]